MNPNDTDKTLDQSLNIGSEIELFEGCTKHVKIGSIGLIREVRQLMKNANFKFSFCIGRDAIELPSASDPNKMELVDIPALEEIYKKAFNMVLVEGLTDEEYENVNEDGIKELDNLLTRFL